MNNPSAWHPDPYGRHELRYWDGSAWTEHVADAGRTSVDHPHAVSTGTVASVANQAASAVRSAASGRPWSFDHKNTEFVYVEWLSLHLPDEQDKYGPLDALAPELAALRGGLPYALSLLDDRHRVIGPPWLSVREAVARPDGRIVATGWPTHRTLDLPDVLDLGAIDGRNLFAWGCDAPAGLQSPNDNLYVGHSVEQYLEMSRIGGSVAAIDLDTTGGTAAAIEHWGADTWRVATIDVTTGTRRYLCDPGSLSGWETVHFSPDAQWILLSECRQQLIFVHATHGGVIRLDVPGLLSASWWPGHGPSVVAMMINHADGPHLASFDCAAPAINDLGPITGPATDLHADRRTYSQLRVHPQRHVALVGAPEGPSNEFQQRFGTRRRVAMLDLDTRHVEVLTPPFVNGLERFERDHQRWRWIAPAAHQPVVFDDQLLASLAQHPAEQPTDTSSVAADAHDLTVFAMKAISDHMDDVHRLRPEALRAYEGARRFGRGAGLDDWLVLLSNAAHESLDIARREYGSNQGSWPREARSLLTFSNGLDLIRIGSYDLIDWADDRTT